MADARDRCDDPRERRLGAVESVLRRRVESLGGDEVRVTVVEQWARDVAEELLAAAETGI